jgi:RimJ/RimL family protein N-acetyltransferase
MARYHKREITLDDGRVISLKNVAATDAHLFIFFQQTIARESYGTNQRVGVHPSVEAIKENWKTSELNQNILRLGAFNGDKLIAQCNLERQNPKNDLVNHNARFSLMLISDYWGSGLACLMMNQIEFAARNMNVKRMEAEVRAENTRGVEFYKKMGYGIEGTRKKAALIEGRYQDEYYIAKSI